jgi:hypothetical protein
MHLLGVVALDEVRLVAVALEEALELAAGDAREVAGVGDLVAVQMQDRQHRAVARRVQELVRMPAGRERTGLGLTVADDARDDQVGVVERGPIRVREGIAELASLVDRPGRLRRHVARDAAGEAELLEELPHPVGVRADVGVHLAVGPFEVRVRDDSRAAVPRADDVDHVEVVPPDDAVQVHVEQVQARRGSPVAEQARLHVGALQRLAQQRIVVQVDLPDREVVRRPPVGVQ